MQTQQHQNVNIYGGSNVPQGSVVIHTVAPVVYVPQQPRTRPAVLPFAKAHMAFGVVQMLVGGLCFLLDVVAVCLPTSSYMRFGAGIYSGIFFFVAGLLGFLAGRHNSTCCVVACMVLNIIASCVAVIGMSFASIEISSTRFYDSADHKTYIHNKSVFVLCACIFEFIFTIVHSSLTCASCCYCCMPRTAVPQPNEIITTTVQGTNQQQMYYPNQQGYYHQHMPPQAMAQAYPQQMQSQAMGQAYPQQQMHPQTVGPAVPPYPVQSASYPQQGNLPYNPAFSPDSSYPEQPPSYSAAVDYKQA